MCDAFKGMVNEAGSGVSLTTTKISFFLGSRKGEFVVMYGFSSWGLACIFMRHGEN